jgi:hypothetical protein
VTVGGRPVDSVRVCLHALISVPVKPLQSFQVSILGRPPHGVARAALSPLVVQPLHHLRTCIGVRMHALNAGQPLTESGRSIAITSVWKDLPALTHTHDGVLPVQLTDMIGRLSRPRYALLQQQAQ